MRPLRQTGLVPVEEVGVWFMYRRFFPPYLWPNFSFCASVCVHQAEARLVAKRAARAEAREIRMRELERQQKEVKSLQMFVTPVTSSTTAVHNKADVLAAVGTVWAVWTNVSCHISLCSTQLFCGSKVTGCSQRTAWCAAPTWQFIGNVFWGVFC